MDRDGIAFNQYLCSVRYPETLDRRDTEHWIMIGLVGTWGMGVNAGAGAGEAGTKRIAQHSVLVEYFVLRFALDGGDPDQQAKFKTRE